MANFKALSSGFVFGSVLLLLLVVINVYPAAAAASCSNSSEVMLFKSSPLKVVEEVAKDQRTTTEIAIDDHHDQIQARRVLQGIGGQVWKFVNKFYSPLKRAKTAYKAYDNLNTNSNYRNDYLDSYCVFPYCYPSTQPGYCLCQEKEVQTRPSPCRSLIPEFYCCKGSTNGICSYCCVGKTGRREILKVTTTSPSSTTQPGVSSISSSQSPIAYVAIAAVIASVILV